MRVFACMQGGPGRIWKLLTWLLLASVWLSQISCEYRSAKAKPRGPRSKKRLSVKVFQNAPQQEPPPRGFLETGEADEPQTNRPKVTVVAGNEVPCPKEAPLGMVCIPGGPFVRGSDQGKADEKPQQRIVVSPFFLDQTEVTNEQYFRCVELGRCEPPIKYFGLYVRPKQPVVAVSWQQSYDFCRYTNKRLPTEAEWEKAARGPDGEVYPWGNQPPNCQLAVYEEPLGAKGCGTGTTQDVATHGAFRYNLFDMAGNSWEWVNDWKTDCYKGCKNECGAACDGPDPLGPCGGGPKPCKGFSEKLLKGGSWYFTGDRMRGAERRGVPPSNRGPHRLGFRCAKTIE